MPNDPRGRNSVIRSGHQESAQRPDYFSRRLQIWNDEEGVTISDADLLSNGRSMVILGEPGMGKSELLKYIGRMAGVDALPATRFMQAHDPTKHVHPGKPLLIDALDEAMSRSEGEAVDKVLAGLDAAGCPWFILSCRAREWQSRTETDLKDIYGEAPLILSIMELTRDEAGLFWRMRGYSSNVDAVLDRMDEQNLSDFYKNPLTLSLLGDVAGSGRALPTTRAELFAHVCGLSWSEHDKSKSHAALNKLTEAQAMGAAGALMASFILAGVEAVSWTRPSHGENDLPISELEQLPGADVARVIVSSKLFRNLGRGRAAPIHRVVAEYLGAKWLADQARTARSRRRLLMQFQGAGAVPSSLRGLHAWLAHHSPALAPLVISADPFGLLRYGDSKSFDAQQGLLMLGSLEDLARRDPYFRAQDWDVRAAHGLTQPAVAARVGSLIGDPTCNVHLRTLLLESIKGSEIVPQVAATLNGVATAGERFYVERKAALDALVPILSRDEWLAIVEVLVDERSDDSARLAWRLTIKAKFDLPNELLVRALLADLGLLDPIDLTTIDYRVVRSHRFDELASTLTPSRAKAILWHLERAAPPAPPNAHDGYLHLAQCACLLLMRALRGGKILRSDIPALWRWLILATHEGRYDGGHANELAVELSARHDLRRAIQRFANRRVRRNRRLSSIEHDLWVRSASIADHPEDVAVLLEEISSSWKGTKRQRNDWRDLVGMSIAPGRDNDVVLTVARQIPNLSMRQMAHLRRLQHPHKRRWQIEHEQRRASHDAELATSLLARCSEYESNIDGVRRGELRLIVSPARAYLGSPYGPSSNESRSPQRRLVDFANELLVPAFMDGFEAALGRSDLPSLEHFSTARAEGLVLGFVYPVLAGLLARMRLGQGFKGVPIDSLRIGLLVCLQRLRLSADVEDLKALGALLETAVAPSIDQKRQMARSWIEPLLKGGSTPDADIHFLSQLDSWSAAAVELAEEWLTRFPNASQSTQAELVSVLEHAGEVEKITAVSRSRDSFVFTCEEQIWSWLAVDVAYRFDEVRHHLVGVGAAHPEFLWFLRDRFQARRGSLMSSLEPTAGKWIVSEFRRPFPATSFLGEGIGTNNGYDATAFLRAIVARLADDTSDEASRLLQELADEPSDLYTDEIHHKVAEQQQKLAEENFQPIAPSALAALLDSGTPTNIDDLKAIVVEELVEAQLRLLGDELDPVRDFWDPDGIPYDENRCRDRLAGLIDIRLADSYSIKLMTEADMPKGKRADLGFASGPKMQLPMEVKGQWHPEVWDAVNHQLSTRYLIDWRSEGRGIYCVLWFGDLASSTGRRIKAHSAGAPGPANSAEMRAMLIDRIPAARRPFIEVVVIDLVTGRK